MKRKVTVDIPTTMKGSEIVIPLIRRTVKNGDSIVLELDEGTSEELERAFGISVGAPAAKTTTKKGGEN